MNDTIMSKTDAAARVVAARLRRGLSWSEIAEEIGSPLVWTTSALLGQHPMTQEQSEQVCRLLDLDDAVAESLRAQPSRGTDQATMTDPTIYRFVEALAVYGPALKELIHDEFGDGIMSAINFRVDFARHPDPAGDRVVVTFDGKFLDYRW
ncbi:cyanate lyase [Haloechinothrix alba]|uniref:Cyanate hydratase n=1 Tax=Haloechinothrix alba TaxID=664784 RepID=A0A238ZMJ9_9PSEU|nr:cyanase [Haloechinothrix alba]SNR84359.1 cyanate lyase [Haloechinothrix alba]